MKTKVTPTQIAKVAHEINAAYCKALGDTGQKSWGKAPQWQKDSAINGVKFHLAQPNAKPSASHDNWMKEKLAAGWKFGEEKDEELKTHPCMVPFDDLPEDQKAKDFLFKQVVKSLSDL